jgi:V8-like Glu-specific endopeptidase
LQSSDPISILGKQSIAAMFTFSMPLDGDGTYGFVNRAQASDLLGADRSLCSDQKFRFDPRWSSCSGTLIAPDRILTAGHCLTRANCATRSFVFNFYVESVDGSGNPTVADILPADVYTCRDVYSVNTGSQDFAIVHLDRAVDSSRHTPITNIETDLSQITVGQSLVMIGFPDSIPMKVDKTGQVTGVDIIGGNTFQASVDAFKGNSGSGVFNSAGDKLLGILVAGQPDYENFPNEDCNRTNVITGCTTACGEQLTYASHANDPVVVDCTTNGDCNGNTLGSNCFRLCPAGSNACTGFCGTASPTVSPSPSISPSASPLTASQTATITPSLSLSSSVTPTISESSSITPTISESGSVTPTISLSSSTSMVVTYVVNVRLILVGIDSTDFDTNARNAFITAVAGLADTTTDQVAIVQATDGTGTSLEVLFTVTYLDRDVASTSTSEFLTDLNTVKSDVNTEFGGLSPPLTVSDVELDLYRIDTQGTSGAPSHAVSVGVLAALSFVLFGFGL